MLRLFLDASVPVSLDKAWFAGLHRATSAVSKLVRLKGGWSDGLDRTENVSA